MHWNILRYLMKKYFQQTISLVLESDVTSSYILNARYKQTSSKIKDFEKEVCVIVVIKLSYYVRV